MTSKISQPKNKEKWNLYSKIGDLSFASLMGKGWYSLPRSIYRRFVILLNIFKVGYKKVGGNHFATITTYYGVTFLGPTNSEYWNCHQKKIKYLKTLLGQLYDYREIADEHCALVHNIILRYMTEFSSPPYQAYRTCNLQSGDIFFDIGAFRGYVTMKASQKIGEEGFVYAIEPINENIEFIKAHIKYNNLTNIKMIEGAVSINKLNEDIQLYKTRNQANSSIPDYLPSVAQSIRTRNISTVSLANLFNNELSSHKRVIASITINGNEMDIVKSFVDEFEKISIQYLEITIPIIYTRVKVPAFTDYMKNRGFRVEKYYPWLKMINMR